MYLYVSLWLVSGNFLLLESDYVTLKVSAQTSSKKIESLIPLSMMSITTNNPIVVRRKSVIVG